MLSFLFIPTYQEPDFKDILIINAPDKTSAMNLFCEIQIQRDQVFLDDLYGLTVNMSFAEKFWMPDGQDIVTPEQFIDGVKEYFKDHPDYADQFLIHWFEQDKEITFTHDMLVYIYNREFEDQSWKVICLKDIPSYTV